jgi:hypothetical protein
MKTYIPLLSLLCVMLLSACTRNKNTDGKISAYAQFQQDSLRISGVYRGEHITWYQSLITNKRDTLQNYRISVIMKDSVTVKLYFDTVSTPMEPFTLNTDSLRKHYATGEDKHFYGQLPQGASFPNIYHLFWYKGNDSLYLHIFTTGSNSHIEIDFRARKG